jgi:hypothetical protein
VKIKEKFIICEGCKKKYTINFTTKDEIKITICTYCTKKNITNLIKKLKMNKKITNEQAFKNLLKNIDSVSLALLRERVLTICEHSAENLQDSGFVSKKLYVNLNEIVQKHLGFEEK